MAKTKRVPTRRDNDGAVLTVEKEHALNDKAARRIMREAKRKPQKWVKGHWVGLSCGKVIAVSLDEEELLAE